MNASIPRTFLAGLFALALTLNLIAQEAPPAAAPAEPTPATAPAPEAAASTASDDEDLRRLDAPEAPADADEKAANVSADDQEAQPAAVTHKHRREYRRGNEFPLGNHTIPAGGKAFEAVSILGSTTVHGEVEREVVSIVGDTLVHGSSGGEAVAVLGDVRITGTVGGEAVAVMGNVDLGPQAVVKGDVTVVGGKLNREVGAVVEGNVTELTIPFVTGGLDGLKAWFHRCLLLGRPLAFGQDLFWAWTIAVTVFLFYVVLALLFPTAFEKCLETLEQRPGYSLLTVLLTVLITPVLFVVLIATGVGLLVVPFLAAGLFIGGLFGKAVMHAWLGRRITRLFGPGPLSHVAMATLIGGVIVLLLYTVPVLGFLLWKLLDLVGLGVIVYTLILGMRRERPAAVKPAGIAPVAAGMAADGVPPLVAGAAAGGDYTGAATSAATAVPVMSAAMLPRAGFWIRVAASFLDLMIIGAACGVLRAGGGTPLVFAAYCVVLWALKGTTIGGIVCGLKVVRLDDRPVDWPVALVRALGGFLSLAVAGLGFIWVAFDDQKQSWHDKIAGTTVVRVPRGMSLV